MKSLISKRYFLATAVSCLLSIFMVVVVAYGATMTISNRGLGSGTSTPGAALGVQGAAIVDDFIWGSALIATSTGQASGFGTTSPGMEFAVAGSALFDGGITASYLIATSSDRASGFGTTGPGAEFAVAGGALFDGKVTGDYFNATSTTATSSIRWSLTAATSTFQVDGVSGRVVIGATTTLPQGGVMGRAFNPDPALTITGTGNAASATGTLYVAGGGASGGEIIIKSGDGNNCVSIAATTGASDPDTAAQVVANLLTFRVVACPR